MPGVPHCVAQSDNFLNIKDNVTLNCVQWIILLTAEIWDTL